MTGPSPEVLDAGLRGVRAGFTTRAGGVSTGAFAAANLARHVGDEPGLVARNRERLAEWAGAPIVFAHQVHGTDVLVVDRVPVEPDPAGHDAIVTAVPGVAVGVLVADCLPVLLADRDAHVVATAHAGRRGLAAGVLSRTLAAMVGLGADADRVEVAIGPAAGGCCYEVPAAMRDEVEAAVPGTATTTSWGTPALDLRAGARLALAALGVRDVRLVGGCTIEDPTLYSFRRDRVTGRFAGVVVCPA